MKVNIKMTKPDFQPRDIIITVETEEELDLLKTLFNTNVTVPHCLMRNGLITKDHADKLSKIMGDIGCII